MARKTDERRDKLRETLTDIAEREVRADGIGSLRARALAQEAGCAVGAIYNVFDDMTGLILAVNGRTFHRLAESVLASQTARGASAEDRLVALGHGYLKFASENPNLWRALFDVQMTEGNVPEWYLKELGQLFAIIGKPLAELHPDASPQELDLMTRTLFSSVHGIVLLGLERRISSVPHERLREMVTFLVRNVASKRP